jgi:soluble lytic murein transglycosylase-like protein
MVSSQAYSAFDPELAQSLRCVSLFRHNEYKYRIPGDTLYSIALQETGRLHSQKKIKLVWPWTVNVEGKGYFFDTKREAVAFVLKQIQAGKESIDVGCMQVNLKHHPRAFKSIDQAFEPRINIAYGAEFLRSKYDQLGDWHKAIAHYHSATEALGSKYKDGVIKIAHNIEKYKDPFRNYSKNYTSNKSYNKIMERKTERMLTSKERQKKYRSNMMILVPRTNS